MNQQTNPWNRRAYGALDPSFYSDVDSGAPLVPQTFAGRDLVAYINNIKVGNLEAVTWSSSTEVVGNYAMGNADALGYTKGKRVIVGSLSMTQWDRHVLLEQVFNLSGNALSSNKPLTQGDLWSPGSVGNAIRSSRNFTIAGLNTSIGGTGAQQVTQANVDDTTAMLNTSVARGVSRTDYARILRDQVQDAARQMAARRINYSDQIPPFDLTLVGVNDAGYSAYATIFGITITQETAGFSMNDLGNTVGMSFVALNISPWRPVVDIQQGVATLVR